MNLRTQKFVENLISQPNRNSQGDSEDDIYEEEKENGMQYE